MTSSFYYAQSHFINEICVVECRGVCLGCGHELKIPFFKANIPAGRRIFLGMPRKLAVIETSSICQTCKEKGRYIKGQYPKENPAWQGHDHARRVLKTAIEDMLNHFFDTSHEECMHDDTWEASTGHSVTCEAQQKAIRALIEDRLVSKISHIVVEDMGHYETNICEKDFSVTLKYRNKNTQYDCCHNMMLEALAMCHVQELTLYRLFKRGLLDQPWILKAELLKKVAAALDTTPDRMVSEEEVQTWTNDVDKRFHKAVKEQDSDVILSRKHRAKVHADAAAQEIDGDDAPVECGLEQYDYKHNGSLEERSKKRVVVEVSVADGAAAVPKKKRKATTCSNCKQTGHNRKSCLIAIIPLHK